ncbi:hypothetical protein ELH40_12595 [Rhizobium ruizarguesonis]|uniref:Uncharacterized protein n=1 Tax=Rhizobium ruizarguesonis TaxID=2081791 RepID=A0AB38I4C0_9HYPH|nr:hypothetical protein ELH40_12595 [Rhizobium ruizarguesonis]
MQALTSPLSLPAFECSHKGFSRWASRTTRFLRPVGDRWPTNRRRCTANAMALDPEKAFLDYSAADCSVQFWTADAPAVQFTSLEAIVSRHVV